MLLKINSFYKRTLALAGIFFIIFYALAGDKLLDLSDVSGRIYYKCYEKDIRNICWRGISLEFTYIQENNLFNYSVKKNANIILLSIHDLSKMVKEYGQVLYTMPDIRWIDDKTFVFETDAYFFAYDILENKIIKSIKKNPEAENFNLEPNSFQLAFTFKNMLFIANQKEAILIAGDSTKQDIVYGKYVHRNEFGIEKGTFWSPDGSSLAFYRNNQQQVDDYPIIDFNRKPAFHQNIKYPMAGSVNEIVDVGIWHSNTNALIYLKSPDTTSHYFTNMVWSPDGSKLYVAELNRGQNYLCYNEYDAKTGSFIKTLFEETHPKYVEPLFPAIFVPCHDSLFIWQSQRNGFNHLYLYNINGKLLKQLTSGKWEVTWVYGFDQTGRYIFFNSTLAGALEQNLYQYDMENEKIIKITRKPGVHKSVIHPSGQYIIDQFSDIQTYNQIDIINSMDGIYKTLAEIKDPLQDYKKPEIVIDSILTDNQTTLYCRIIKPPAFNRKKKYPVMVYVYGGPHNQLITHSWLAGATLFDIYMAQQGYIVFSIDNRGSDNRGLEFENATFRNLGKIEMEDQLAGIEYLKRLPYVDKNRIGVYGWSFGGFMSIFLKLTHPEIFKVAVAGGPVINWKYYEIMYTERYMDTPDENPEGYEFANLCRYVDNLEGKLLVIHGAIDPVVVWQHSMYFLNCCIEANKLVDYFVYPDHEHNILGRDRIHLNYMISNYFIKNL